MPREHDAPHQLDRWAEHLFCEHPELSIEDWRRCLASGIGPDGPIDRKLAGDLAELLAELEMIDSTDAAEASAAETGAFRSTDTRAAAGGRDSAARAAGPLDGPSQMPLWIRGSHGSVYELVARVDTGGHAIVYRGRQREPFDRQVAVKVAYAAVDCDTGSLQALPEVQAIQRLEHPGVCQVFDAGVTAWGQPFLVMEFVEGRPLGRFLAKEAPSLAQRLDLFGQVLEVIAHAHARGVVHRDIKPSNVLVHAASGRVKVIDFGIARLTEPATTVTAQVGTSPAGTSTTLSGTRGYRSPEQAGLIRHRTGHRSDIYSLGCLLFEMLTDEPAFRDEDLLSLTADLGADRGLARRMHRLHPRLEEELPECRPADLAELIERCVAVWPADRLASVEAFTAQLAACLAGERLPRLAPRVWLRRHRLQMRRAAVAAGAVLAATVATLLVSQPWQAPLAPHVDPRVAAEGILVNTLGPASDPALSTPLGEAAGSREAVLAGVMTRLDALEPAVRKETGRQLVQLAFDASLFDVCRRVTEELLDELEGSTADLPLRAEMMTMLLAQNVIPDDAAAVRRRGEALIEELRETGMLATPEGLRLVAVFSHMLKERFSDQGRLAADALLAPFLAEPDDWLAVDPETVGTLFVNAVANRVGRNDAEPGLAIAERLRALPGFEAWCSDEDYARLLILTADAYDRIGQPEKTIAVLEGGLASERTFPRGRRNTFVTELADVLERMGRLDDALERLLSNATTEMPSRVIDASWMFQTSLQTGRVLLKLDRVDAAVPELTRAVAIFEAWPDALVADAAVFAYVWLAEGQAAAGDTAAAVAAFKTAAANLRDHCANGRLPESMGKAVGGRIQERIDELLAEEAAANA